MFSALRLYIFVFCLAVNTNLLLKAQSTPTQAQSISDETAYRLFFKMIARHPNLNPDLDLSRRQTYVRHYFGKNLGKQQIDHLLLLADSVNTKSIEAAKNNHSASLVRADKDKIVSDALQSLSSSDASMMQSLQTHVINHVKPAVRLGADVKSK